MFSPVPPDIDFVALEQAELARWAAHRVFERSMEQREDAPPWVFYEGPPTANGMPGLHHVWARVYKDLFCRFRTMRGSYVARRAGWDTHGLPVEVEVEKRLGITGKEQIESQVGIAEFVRLCRESVYSYVDEFARLTTRIGYWVDMDTAYWTLDASYIESVWWHLQQLFDQGLLYEDLKVVPYCPRCGTALSSHELGQPDVYRDEEDESAYVRLRLVDPPAALVGLGPAEWLAVWTTTPWTLLSNTGVAVNPELTYAVVDGVVVADDLVDAVMGEGASARVSSRFPGSALVGLHYERPFDDLDPPHGADGWRVVPASYVTTEEGTGLVHLAPAFGEVDRQIGRDNGLPSLNPVGPDGRFTDAVPWLAGRDVREANHDINDRLESGRPPDPPPPLRPLVPALLAVPDAADLLGQAQLVHRHVDPQGRHAGGQPHGRLAPGVHPGRALRRVAGEQRRLGPVPRPLLGYAAADLALRARARAVRRLAGRAVRPVRAGRDGDRPAPAHDRRRDLRVPDVCGRRRARRRGRRVVGVPPGRAGDRRLVRLGSMPAAQVGYPYAAGSAEAFAFPADFISEAIDQTRGWFYSLLAINTLVFGESPYRHVVCLGHIVDAEGRKMSKSLGNIIDPWSILDTRGADAMRWWMFSQGSPWTPTRATLGAIDTAMRDMLLTLWNTFSFFTTYASLNEFDPADPAIPAPADRGPLDRWILSRLASTTAEVTTALTTYEPLAAATALGDLVDDLSNWYVRRSRRRFWRTDPDAPAGDTLAAQATLHATLTTLSLLLAPLCPFVSDAMWRHLTGAGDGDGDGAGASVHLADWPTADGSDSRIQPDPELEAQMALARRLTSLGRAARSEASVKVRQPLRRALVFLPADAPDILREIVADELNVDEIDTADDLSEVLQFELVANFKTLGARLRELVKELPSALAALDSVAVAAELEAGRSITVTLGGRTVELSPDDVQLRVRGQQGFAVSREGGEVVALDLNLDDGLRKRGLSRDVVRLVQDLRKASGLEVSDRIRLSVVGLDPIAGFFEYIAREVLAVEVVSRPGPGEGTLLDLDDELLTEPVRVWIERVEPVLG